MWEKVYLTGNESGMYREMHLGIHSHADFWVGNVLIDSLLLVVGG